MMKYPNKINLNHAFKSHANRGMSLEDDLNSSNNYYLDNDIAVIYKKPTPVKVLKRVDAKIVDAFYEKPSTTDYNGIYNGKYIDFEAKETTCKSSFPLSNIHPHQISHIRKVIKHKGICFLIVRFSLLNKTFLLFGKDFIWFLDNNKRKSIPLEYFIDKGYLIKDKLAPRVDYLKIVDKYGGIL